MAERITERTLKTLTPPAAGHAIVYDLEVRGFGVRITTAGVVSFIFRYRIHGKEHSYTIGRYPEYSIVQGREEARRLRGEVNLGNDPLGSRERVREAPTMSDLADDYLERHARPFKRAISVRDDEYMLDLVIKPKLGNHKVDALTRRNIEELHQSFKATPYKANRILALLSKMFSLAKNWGWRLDNPVEGVPRFQELSRERFLDEAEINAVVDALRALENQNAADAIRLLILTGARKGETLAATWSEFDLERGVWTKPSHHTKQKRTERVPLSPQALALVKGMKKKEKEGSEFLFPGKSGHMEDVKKQWKEVCKAAKITGVRVHDLRHSFASFLIGSGVSLPMIGKLLGHTQPQTTAKYAHLADDPMREAINKFPTLGIDTNTKKKARKKRKANADWQASQS